MRVTHVITRLIVGGAQENTIASVLGLRRILGLEVDLLSGPTTGPEGSLASAFAKIPDDIWNKIEEKLKEEFRDKNYSAGVLALINEMGEVLLQEFPTRAGVDNDDEMKDEIVIN